MNYFEKENEHSSKFIPGKIPFFDSELDLNLQSLVYPCMDLSTMFPGKK